MFYQWSEYQGQRSIDKHGEIRLNTEYVTTRKPGWWVSLKLLALLAMLAVGYGILVPSLLQVLPLFQSVLLATGLMLIYLGLAFFVRAEANTDNMGWFGFANDPTQYSDNINRMLFNLHCFFGPGRFASETLLDACVVLGLAGGEEVVADHGPVDLGNAVSHLGDGQEKNISAELCGSNPKADRFDLPPRAAYSLEREFIDRA